MKNMERNEVDTKNKKYSIDTNILVYATNPDSVHHNTCRELIVSILSDKLDCFIVDKCLYEFYAVVTNTVLKGKHQEAVEIFNYYLNQFKSVDRILISSKNTINTVSSKVKKMSVRGGYIHDIVIASILLENDIDVLYTYNTKDFEGIEGLEIISPLS